MLAVATGVLAAVALATPAWATTEYVGGGTWQYGVSLGINYSYYYHPNNNHSSAVKSNGITRTSGCQAPGTYAIAEIAAISPNTAYWNNSC